MWKLLKSFFFRYPNQNKYCSLIPLNSLASEKELSKELFNLFRVDGYCLWRETVDDFLLTTIEELNRKNLSAKQNNKIILEVCEFYRWVKKLPEEINKICIYSANPGSKIDNSTSRQLQKEALRNHERFHALNLSYPNEIVDIIDYIMYLNIGEKWDQFGSILLEWDTHTAIRDRYGDNWVVVLEGLARVAVVLHTPLKHQPYVARCQFPTDPNLLLSISYSVESIFGSAEELLEKAASHNLSF